MKQILCLNLHQGIGAQSIPVVKKGDRVKRGQIIATADSEKLSVPLHASVNGIVMDVSDNYILLEKTDDDKTYVPLDHGDSIVDTVHKAGIIGLGGAGFPTYMKLKTKLKPGGYFICNAAECEPVLSHNMEQIIEEMDFLIEGMHLCMKEIGAEKGIIGIKLKHKEEIKAIVSFLKDQKISDIRVLPLRNVYPVGEERALIRDTINVLLPPGSLPSEANAVVMNVETICSIYEAVVNRKPLIDKYVTVAGKLKDIPKGEVRVERLPIGTKFDDIVGSFGGFDGEIGEVIHGGPYTGKRAGINDCIVKTTGGILVTAPFESIDCRKLGIIRCACGPSLNRLEEVAVSMNATIVGHQICKNAHEAGSGYKCENPGHCPGQAEKVLVLKKMGADDILIGHCSDCTNTVMGSAPKLGMHVHHVTDHVLKTMGMPVIREFNENQL